MKKIFLLLLILFSIQGNAQIYVDNQGNMHDLRKQAKRDSTQTQAPIAPLKKSSFDKTKLEFGGNFGLQFGDYTLVNISPQVGYKFSKYVSAGLGLGYTYSSQKYYTEKDKYSAFTFGAYSRIYPVDFLILSVQPEVSRVWRSVEDNGSKYSDSHVAPSFLIGGGIRYQNIAFLLQYDVVQNKYSPYGNGVIYSAGIYF